MTGIKFLIVFLLNVAYSYLAKISSETPIDINKNTQEMAIAHGYPAENYTVDTADEYILTIFRIPGKKGETLDHAKKHPRQPVILQHGLIDSSDTFLINENPSLAYMLADEGYDVWLPNFRGNDYSRFHERLSPDDNPEFWDYSIDEVIDYDIRAIFELVISTTGYQKISHVGHSMGGGSILAAASKYPEFYAAHLKAVVGLSPSTCSRNANDLLRFAEYSKALDLLEYLGADELFNLHPKVQNLISFVCSNVPDLCNFVIRFLAGNNPAYDNSKKYDVFFNHYPSATSVHQLRHILQQTTEVGYFTYRREGNSTRSEYRFDKVPAQISVAVYAGLEDKLVSAVDARWLRDKLALGGSMREYKEYVGYGHLTYLLPAADHKCYLDTIAFLKKY